MSEVKSLEDKIIKATIKYERGEDLYMTDAQFDTAIERLRSLDAEHWILKTVGWGFNDENSKIKHVGKNPVGSLPKIQFPLVPEAWESNVLILPKLDGLSVILYARDGKLVAATRNDGFNGKDCTSKLINILQAKTPSVVPTLTQYSQDALIAIRGEVITDPRFHRELGERGEVSLRNYAAGLINRIEDNDELKYLLFVPYAVRINSKHGYPTRLAMLEHLSHLGFYPIPHYLVEKVTSEELEEVYQTFKLQFLIDGLVLSSASPLPPLEVDFTELEGHSTAYKFPGETAEAIVEHIEWNTGSAGRIAPVAVLTSPVLLAGANIGRISCHHAKYVTENAIGCGAHVVVTRANDVIPQVVSVLKTGLPPALPGQCPDCSAPTAMSGCYLTCTSNECPSKARTAIYRLIEVAGMPRGLGESTVEDWLNRFPVNQATSKVAGIVDFVALFRQVGGKGTAARGNLLRESFNPHFGGLLFELESNIDKLLTEGLEQWQFWYVLNLPTVAKSNSQKLAMYSPADMEFMILNHPEKLKEIKAPYTVGEAIRDNSVYWKQLAPLIKLKSYSGNTNALRVVVTGSVSLPRTEWAKKMESEGVCVVDVVSKDTKYVVCNDTSKSSSKLKKAEKLGIPILTESEFIHLLKTQLRTQK